MAISYFKNTVASFWNRNIAKLTETFPAEEAEAERTHLKSSLLSVVFTEPVDMLANQYSDAIARIAKVDFPRHWDGIVPGIIQTIANADNLVASDTKQGLQLAKRAYDVLDQLLESLTAKRLMSARQSFEDLIVKTHFESLQTSWFRYVQMLLQALASLSQQSSAELLASITLLANTTHLATRCLYHCISNCSQLICSSPIGATLFPVLAEVMTRLAHAIGAVPKATVTNDLRNLVNRIRGYAANAVADAQKDAPLPFRRFLGPFLGLYNDLIAHRAQVRLSELHVLALEHSQGEVGMGWGEDDETNEEAKGNDMCTIQALNFMTSVLVNSGYRASNGGIQSDSSFARAGMSFGPGGIGFDATAAQEVRAVLDAFVTDQWCTETIQRIVKAFLPWGRYDFQSWMDDPEAFFHRYSLNRSEVDERTAAESLLGAIASVKPQLTASLLRDWLSSVVQEERSHGGPCPGLSAAGEQPAGSEVLLSRWTGSAVMSAIGLIMFEMRNVMDIAPLVDLVANQVQTIVNACGSAGVSSLTFEAAPQAVTTLQRAVWLAGHFVDVVDSATVERLSALVVCLTQVADPVIRLCAVEALKSYVDSVHMEAIVDNFTAQRDGQQSFMEFSIKNLLTLCAECREFESKAKVLTCVRLIVEGVRDRVGPVVPALMEALPVLWEKAADEKLLRQSIVLTLTAMTISLRGRSQIMIDVLMPVVSFSTDINNDDAASLLPHGLELWRAVVFNCVSLTPALVELFQHWIQMYREYEDDFEVGVEVLQGYIIAGKVDFLTRYGGVLGPVLLSLMTRLGEDNLQLLLNALEFIAQVAPSLMVQHLQPLLAEALKSIQNFVLNGDDALSTTTIAMYYQIFSHLLIREPQATLAFIGGITDAHGSSILGMFVDQFIESAEHIDLPYKRKQAAMALMQLLTLDRSLLRHGDSLISYVGTELLEDEVPENQYKPQDLSNVPMEDQNEPFRVAAIANSDPANQTRLSEWIVSRLRQCAGVNGDEFVKALLDSLRPDMRDALRI